MEMQSQQLDQKRKEVEGEVEEGEARIQRIAGLFVDLFAQLLLFRHKSNDLFAASGARVMATQACYFIRNREPIRLVLAGFPFKNPEPGKCLGRLPDQAEHVALHTLHNFAVEVRVFYPLGVVWELAADGSVWGDLIGVSYQDYKAYGLAVRKMHACSLSPPCLRWHTLPATFPCFSSQTVSTGATSTTTPTTTSTTATTSTPTTTTPTATATDPIFDASAGRRLEQEYARDCVQEMEVVFAQVEKVHAYRRNELSNPTPTPVALLAASSPPLSPPSPSELDVTTVFDRFVSLMVARPSMTTCLPTTNIAAAGSLLLSDHISLQQLWASSFSSSSPSSSSPSPFSSSASAAAVVGENLSPLEKCQRDAICMLVRNRAFVALVDLLFPSPPVTPFHSCHFLPPPAAAAGGGAAGGGACFAIRTSVHSSCNDGTSKFALRFFPDSSSNELPYHCCLVQLSGPEAEAETKAVGGDSVRTTTTTTKKKKLLVPMTVEQALARQNPPLQLVTYIREREAREEGSGGGVGDGGARDGQAWRYEEN